MAPEEEISPWIHTGFQVSLDSKEQGDANMEAESRYRLGVLKAGNGLTLCQRMAEGRGERDLGQGRTRGMGVGTDQDHIDG